MRSIILYLYFFNNKEQKRRIHNTKLACSINIEKNIQTIKISKSKNLNELFDGLLLRITNNVVIAHNDQIYTIEVTINPAENISKNGYINITRNKIVSEVNLCILSNLLKLQ